METELRRAWVNKAGSGETKHVECTAYVEHDRIALVYSGQPNLQINRTYVIGGEALMSGHYCQVKYYDYVCDKVEATSGDVFDWGREELSEMLCKRADSEGWLGRVALFHK